MTTVVRSNLLVAKVALVSFDGADQALSILNDWMKGAANENVYRGVLEVRDALQAIMQDADCIMLEDT